MKADTAKATRMLKTAKGQLEGVLKMVEDDRYCVDISNQIMAVIAILRNTNRDILQAHLEDCIRGAMDPAEQEKIREMISIIDKLSK